MSRPLRVAVVTETYPPEINGVALTIGRMVQGLQGRHHSVQLIRPRQGSWDSPAGEGNLEVVLRRGLPIPRYQGLRMGLPAGPALRRLWGATRPDVVHIVTEGPLGWSALRAAQALQIPVTADFHTNFHRYSRYYGLGWLARPIAAYLRHFHNRAHYTLVPGEGLRRELKAQGYRNLTVVGRGVDIRLFSPERRNGDLRRSWGAAERDPVVVYVGRLAPEKNLRLVADAFRAIRNCEPRARLVWVGDGPERRALQARYPDHVFAGMRTGRDLAAHYASADIFLFPSLTETFGNVTLEAMASGLAVVAFDYAAAADNLRHGESGLLAAFGDGRRFCELAAGLAANPGEIARLGQNARKAAEQQDWDNITDQFEKVLAQAALEGDRHGCQDRPLSEPDQPVGPGALPPL